MYSEWNVTDANGDSLEVLSTALSLAGRVSRDVQASRLTKQTHSAMNIQDLHPASVSLRMLESRLHYYFCAFQRQE